MDFSSTTNPLRSFSQVLCASLALIGWQSAPPRAAVAQTPAPAGALFLGDKGVDLEIAQARQREQRAERVRWELATTLGEYERTGSKDPRWDADARAAMENMAHFLAGDDPHQERSAAAKAACERALAAGCTDPLVGYFGLRLRVGAPAAGGELAAWARRFQKTNGELQASGYPPLRKCYGAVRAAEACSKAVGKGEGAPSAAEVDGLIAQAQARLAEVLADPAVERGSALACAGAYLNFVESCGANPERTFEPLTKLFPIERKDPVLSLLFEGRFWIDYAWQARTAQYANKVTAEGWRLFGERLPRAQAALERAWEKDPGDPRAALDMMTVELGQGEGRARLETWFRRALDANPDSYEACDRKLNYLEPKWHGSAETMLEFGRQCLATGNWPARLPFILLNAHTRLARYEKTPLDYWKRPAVWADVRSLYQACLAADPDSVFDQSGYALYAYRAEQWKLADELFRKLGGKPNLRAMDCTPAQYEEMRRTAAANAAKTS